MGRLNSHQQDYTKAIKYYSDALELDNSNTDVFIWNEKQEWMMMKAVKKVMI
jgi:tetratricopeptide (TPR) repeat protein